MGLQPQHKRRTNAGEVPVSGAGGHAHHVNAPVKIKIADDARRKSSPSLRKDQIGEEIIALAEACGTRIPKRTDPAELLVAIEEDTEIPLNALAAVAEILNFLCDEDRPRPDLRPNFENPS